MLHTVYDDGSGCKGVRKPPVQRFHGQAKPLPDCRGAAIEAIRTAFGAGYIAVDGGLR